MNVPHWLNPNRWFLRTAASHGLRDAEHNLPKPEDFREVGANSVEPVRLAFFEAEQVDIAEERISRLLQGWARLRHRLEIKAQRLEHQFKHLLTEFRTHVQAHATRQFQHPAPPSLPIAVSILLTLIIAGGETVFNASGFAILRMRDSETLVFALALAVAQTVLAYWAGVLLKQFRARRIAHPYSVPGTLVALGFLLILVPAIVGYLRAIYVGYVNHGDAETPAPDLDLSMAAAFCVTSLVLEAVAAVGAYMSAPHDPELVRVIHDKDRTAKRLERLWHSWEAVASKHDGERAALEARIEEVQYDVIGLCDEYRAYNRLGSPERPCPSFFQRALYPALVFQTRNLGPYLEHPPATLNEILCSIERNASVHPLGGHNHHQEVPNEAHFVDAARNGSRPAAR